MKVSFVPASVFNVFFCWGDSGPFFCFTSMAFCSFLLDMMVALYLWVPEFDSIQHCLVRCNAMPYNVYIFLVPM